MKLSLKQKAAIKKALVNSLKDEKEITKIIIFGSFIYSDEPKDLDVAVLQDSQQGYLELAMRYRKKTRSISNIVPLDIIPLKALATDDPFLVEVQSGELIYER